MPVGVRGKASGQKVPVDGREAGKGWRAKFAVQLFFVVVDCYHVNTTCVCHLGFLSTSEEGTQIPIPKWLLREVTAVVGQRTRQLVESTQATSELPW